MNPYPAYKESGVPWLGEVPEHWKKFRVKNVIELITKSSNDPHKIGLENIESGTGKFLQTDSHFEGNGTQFQVGDIVYGKLRPYLQKVWIAEFPGNAVGDFYVFRPKSAVNVQFLRFMFLSQSYTDVINSSTYGAKMPRVSSAFILSLACYIPPLEEQTAIATYLDAKCAQIDELVARRQGIIEKLRELKQAIIAQTVTKGLNPHVPMKDSGVDWLGELPGHWDCRKLGALFNERRTKVSDKEYEPLSVARIGVVPQLETAVKTDAGDNRKLVCAGDFVINSRSDRKGSCGVADRDGSVSLINTVLTPRKMWDAKYVHHLLRSRPFSEEYYRHGRGIVADLWTTRFSEMKSIYLPIPPLEEQAATAAYLDEKCARIDELILRHERTVEKLKELKAATIAEVVTGKVDVRKETKQQIT